MKSVTTMTCSHATVILGAIAFGVVAGGCAAERKAGNAPASPASEAAPAAGYAAQPTGQAAGARPADADSTPKTAPPPAPSTGGNQFAPPPNRAAAMSQATNDVETSQRELDVAGGDCRNACRALGSMDRAAGRLCGLAQSNDEVRRCSDAKTRVYSARDRVRNTCGTCSDTSVDRNAPIPSR